MPDHKDDEHGAGLGTKILVGIGIATVAAFALEGFSNHFPVRVGVNYDYNASAVGWGRPACGGCGRDVATPLTPEEYRLLRNVYQ